MPRRCIVYIDGYNLYYGSLKNTAYKWLDLQKLFEKLRPDDEVLAIKYFTAKVNDESGQRQQKYLSALATRDKIEIIYGRFQRKRVRCHVKGCDHPGNRQFKTFEEKRTDVNIAITMLDDAYQDEADIIVVVSADADLAPPVLRIKHRFPEKTIILCVPANNPNRGAATELRESADRDRSLPLGLIKHCQLPNPVVLTDGSGIKINKPIEW